MAAGTFSKSVHGIAWFVWHHEQPLNLKSHSSFVPNCICQCQVCKFFNLRVSGAHGLASLYGPSSLLQSLRFPQPEAAIALLPLNGLNTNVFCFCTRSLVERPDKSEWLNVLLKRFPPLMHKWFSLTFPEPAAWFSARLNFTRSTAVWSMVGHSIGLGDRHGENITVDGMSGDCIHVDFGMLFDKGLVLTVPEIVPFRLTQNVIDSFGIAGVEGVFRKCAEISLQVIHMPFLYAIDGSVWRPFNCVLAPHCTRNISERQLLMIVDDLT